MMFNMAAINGVVSSRRWMSDSAIDFGSSVPLAEAHVLAVDDSVIDRKVIERLLKTTSCKVTAVDSGMRALEFLGLDEEQRSSVVDVMKVDLIITDYCMPGMSGFELLKKIKESSTFKETPVVIMSSENVLARIDRCLEEGAEDFILKPVKLSDVKRLRDYMSKEERSNCNLSGVNKRKHMEASDLSTDSSMSPLSSQSPPSISTSSSMASQSTSPSTPSSPCGPFDPPSTPSSPSEPLDGSTDSSPSRPGPSDSPSRRLKMTVDEPDQLPVDGPTAETP